jgi:O-antigen/teichoic acid export membrane protein
MAASAKLSPGANFLWLMAERGWRVLLGLVVNVAVARHVGPGEFGVLSYALGLIAIFWVLGGLGFDEVLTRELVRDGARARALLAVGLRLKTAGAACAFVALLVVAWMWRPGTEGTWLIVVLAGCGLFFLPVDTVDAWFLARERMRPPVLARQTALLAAALLRIGLVFAGAPLPAFALAFMVEALLVALALGWVLVRDGGRPDWPGAAEISGRHLLREGWPLLVSSVLVVVTLQADRLLLVHLAGEAPAGVYAAAARFTEVLYALPMAVGSVLLPRLTTLHQEDRPGYWDLARRAGLGLLLAGGLLAAGLSLGGHWLLPRLLGEQYQSSGAVLAVHSWSLVFIALVSLRSRLLIIDGHSRWVMAMSAGTTLLNVLGNLWLIPVWGPVGAAWASTGAWACSVLVLPWLGRTPRAFVRTWCGLAKPR